MPSFKGKKDGNWVEASAIYGKLAGSWLYAKEAFVKKDGSWQRAWTDCRKYDAGGRDWSAPVSVDTYSGSCGNRTKTTTVTRTKTGCPDDVRQTTVSSPDCGASCYDAATVTQEYYDGSCGNRRLREKTVTNPKAGSNCPSTTTYGSPYSSPDCNSGCFTSSAVDCDGCGSATLYTANAGTNCTTYTVGSCGTWDSYSSFEEVVPLTVGSFPYAIFSLYFSAWLYTNSDGTVFVSCVGGGGYVGPGGVVKCSVSNTYKQSGTDTCNYV